MARERSPGLQTHPQDPQLRSLGVPGPSLIPALSLQKHSTLLWATSKDKLSTLQPGVSKEGSGIRCSQHLPIPGRTGDSDRLVLKTWHLLTLTYSQIRPVQVLGPSQLRCRPRVSGLAARKPGAPAKFSLLPKGHTRWHPLDIIPRW